MAPRVSLWSIYMAVLRSPRATLADVAARGEMREGLAAMLVLGVVHAGFSLLLHLAGHAPRMGIPGLGREGHYLRQAIFVAPLYLALFWIGGLVTHAVARRLSGSGSRDASRAVFGVAYAVPMTVLFLVPDLLVFGRIAQTTARAAARSTSIRDCSLGSTAKPNAARWISSFATLS